MQFLSSQSYYIHYFYHMHVLLFAYHNIHISFLPFFNIHLSGIFSYLVSIIRKFSYSHSIVLHNFVQVFKPNAFELYVSMFKYSNLMHIPYAFRFTSSYFLVHTHNYIISYAFHIFSFIFHHNNLC